MNTPRVVLCRIYAESGKDYSLAEPACVVCKGLPFDILK